MRCAPVGRRMLSCAGVAAVAMALLAAIPRAQSPRPLTLVGLAELPRVQDVQLSPDGRFVSYMLARNDWKANRQVAHIFRQAVAGGSPAQLTSTDGGESAARWSPDARTLAYLARGENGLQIFLLPADGGGAPRQLTRHATGVFGGFAPTWSPDGSTIYFLAADAQPDLERERERLRDDVIAFEERYRQRHLWRVSVAGGSEERLSSGQFSVIGLRISRDGRQLVQQRSPTGMYGDNFRSETWLSDANGSNPRALTSNRIEEQEAELSPDGRRIMFIAESNDVFEPYHTATLFVVDATGGTPRRLAPNFQYTIERATWSPDGAAIFAVANMGVHSEVFSIDARSGAARQLTSGDHSVQSWSLVPSAGTMIFQFDEPTRLGDAWTLGLDGERLTRVTNVYGSLATDYQLPRQEKVSWKSTDGTTIEGIAFYPSSHRAGAQLPLIVQLHGGPQDSDRFGYGAGVLVNYLPILVSRGYMVFRPNYRGSTGYGDEFFRDVIGNYFKNMHLDVMTGIDYLVAQGHADPDRLGVMGWSAGGHLTNKLVTFTTRFKAASSTAGAANWLSFFAETDTRNNRAQWFGGLPWDPGMNSDMFWVNSPLRDIGKARTPMLLFAGQEDTRVPVSQSIEMFRGLRANDVPARLHIAPREGHQWTELRHQLFKANAELEWFERYVRERAYVWERAPGDPVDGAISTIQP